MNHFSNQSVLVNKRQLAVSLKCVLAQSRQVLFHKMLTLEQLITPNILM